MPAAVRMRSLNQVVQRKESDKVSTTQQAELCNLHLIVFDCEKMWQAAPPQNCSATTKTGRQFRLLCWQWALSTAENGRGRVSNRGKGSCVATSQCRFEFSFDHATTLQHSPSWLQMASDLQASSDQILQRFRLMPKSLWVLSCYYSCFFFFYHKRFKTTNFPYFNCSWGIFRLCQVVCSIRLHYYYY